MPVIVRAIPPASRKGPTTELPAASTTVTRARARARSVKEHGEDGVDLVGGQQGGAVAKAG